MVRNILSTSAYQDCVNNDHQIVNLAIPSPPFSFLDRHFLLNLYRDCQDIYQLLLPLFGTLGIRWRTIIRADTTGRPKRDDI